METKYKYQAYQLPLFNENSGDLMKNLDEKISSFKFQNQGLFKYGYIHFYNKNRTKLKLLNNPKFKGKTFYNVVNRFEPDIKQYNEDISTMGNKYFGKTVTHNSFYELWELLTVFNLIDTKTNSVNMMHINDVKSSFNDAANIYRKKSNGKSKDKLSKNECDLVTINNADPYLTDIFAEQDHYMKLLEGVVTGLKAQKNGGNMVIKIYDMYTEVTIKLIYVLQSVYKKMFISKPYMSDLKTSDRYIVAMDYQPKDSKNVLKVLEKLLVNMKKIDKSKNYVGSIFSDLTLSGEYEAIVKYINMKLSNLQFKEVNKLVLYINGKNYFGDTYHTYLDQQKDGHKFWINSFLSNDTNKIQQDVMIEIANNKDKVAKLYGSLW
jgi:hypothetical protein